MLYRDDLRLALEAAEDAGPGLLDHIRLVVNDAELQAVRSRAAGLVAALGEDVLSLSRATRCSSTCCRCERRGAWAECLDSWSA